MRFCLNNRCFIKQTHMLDFSAISCDGLNANFVVKLKWLSLWLWANSSDLYNHNDCCHLRNLLLHFRYCTFTSKHKSTECWLIHMVKKKVTSSSVRIYSSVTFFSRLGTGENVQQKKRVFFEVITPIPANYHNTKFEIHLLHFLMTSNKLFVILLYKWITKDL